jgi:hypothetical protein
VRASVFAITAAGRASVVFPAIARWHCECACANPRGAYAPRSCIALRTSVGEKTIFAMHERTSSQERRASARRGYRYRTCNEKRFRHERRSSSSRAASVSPPWISVSRLQRRFRKVARDCRRCAHRRWCSRGSEPTGGLRPPLLIARTHIVGDARLRFATAFCFTRGANAPRSWLYMRLCIAKVAISPARVRAFKQERRVSARRAVRETQLQHRYR